MSKGYVKVCYSFKQYAVEWDCGFDIVSEFLIRKFVTDLFRNISSLLSVRVNSRILFSFFQTFNSTEKDMKSSLLREIKD